MTKPYNKKEVVYYIDSDDDEAVRKLRADLYDTYDDVAVYYNGLHEKRIVCTCNQWIKEIIIKFIKD